MHTLSRRRFALATLAAPSLLKAANKPDKINLAFIGPGGMGTNHIKTMCQRDDVIFSFVCDADTKRAEAGAKLVQEFTGQTPKVVTDMRRVFEDKSVQAVLMATPDHWHAPGAILAAQAGKHVYVEKPCSHNLREGRLMIEAAAQNKVCMQVGTQSRSTASVAAIIEKLRSGIIGEILVAKAWNSQLRKNHGHQPDGEPPPELDYDLWLGPVPKVPFKKTYHPAHWRWFHHFGAGDFGNDGVHDIDIARWGLGVEQHPNRIIGQGSKLFFDDDQEWPDTLYCAFEYDIEGKTKQLIYEQRDWSPYVQEGHENGCAWYGTKGMVIGGKVTLRGDQMYEFLDRLITIALPRVKDFRGLKPTSFDGRGNYAMGLKEHLVFPEINYDQVDQIWGMDIIVCTTARTNDEAKALLGEFNFPFRN